MSDAEEPIVLLPRRRIPWLLIALLAALVLVPLVAWEWPREKRRWQVARAVQAHVEGKRDEALTALDEILRDDPTNVPVLLLRAEWQLEEGAGDRALQDVEDAYAVTHSDDRRDLWMQFIRSQAYVAVGKYEDAARDADELVGATNVNTPAARGMYLNWAAYVRAIGNFDLEKGLQQVNEALKLTSAVNQMAPLDTRAFVYYRLGRHAEALTDLNLALRDVELELAAWEKEYGPGSYRPADADTSTRRQFRNWAVIYYHRGLVYEALSEPDKAEADWKQVRDWGFEPTEELY